MIKAGWLNFLFLNKLGPANSHVSRDEVALQALGSGPC